MAVAVSALLLSCSLSLSSSDYLVNNYLLQVDKDKGKDNYLMQIDKNKGKDNNLLQVDKANHSETGADYSEDGGSEEGPSEATRTEDEGGGDYSGLPGGSKCATHRGELCTFPFKYTDGLFHSECEPYAGQYWCATQLNADKTFATWDFCVKDRCSEESGSEYSDSDSQHPRDSLRVDNSCKCGISSKLKKQWVRGNRGKREVDKGARIVGGRDAREGAFPWLVTLEQEEDGSFYCGGSIIASRHVVTAAHCFDHSDVCGCRCSHGRPRNGRGKETLCTGVWVRYADHDRDNTEQTLRSRGVAKLHPGYDNQVGWDNDIAVVLLDKAFNFRTFSGRVAPVCLARENSVSYAGSKAVVAGWGRMAHDGDTATVLQQTFVKIMANQECVDKTASNKDEGAKLHSSSISSLMLCASGRLLGGGRASDACQGDSGGPLVVFDSQRGRFTQVGVVSWGKDCALARFPGVYARISKLEKWALKEASRISVFCKE